MNQCVWGKSRYVRWIWFSPNKEKLLETTDIYSFMLHLTASGRTSGVRCILPHCLRRSPLCFTFWLPFVALRCLSYQQDWPETADLVIKFLLEVKWKVLQVVLGVWDRTGMRCDYFRKRRGIVFVFLWATVILMNLFSSSGNWDEVSKR